MAQQQKYFIGPSLLSDIRQTITRVDAIAPRISGADQPVRLQEFRQSDVTFRLQRGTFTGAWNIGSTSVVTIAGSTNTIQVTNYCTPVGGTTSSTQTFNVIFGTVMGTVTAVEVQQNTCVMTIGGVAINQIPGYSAGVIQLLGHNTSSTVCHNLQWYSIATCGAATSTP